ncbi:hypothetical protein [Saccharospirillum salsuginis]|uniref:Uncharacterized protein n=1 Tax=Saccharospirillum salsuginis TaxID=418750 RepID=A0A918KSI3_9GAMM|nr:hypothetical protein [Saccharospirillum salsuginis]GGX74251.1 hypothetical protein GCM10007392_47030 [Saccharospirillum salsuginis]
MTADFNAWLQSMPPWAGTVAGFVVAALAVVILVRVILPWRRLYGDRLVLKEYPLLEWPLGLVLVVFSGYSFYTDAPVALWLTAGIPGLALMVYPGIITCTANKQTRVLILETRSVWKHTIKEFPFDDIRSFHIDQNHSDSGSEGTRNTYRLVLVLNNRERIPFRSGYTFKSRLYKKWIKALESYIELDEVESPQARARRLMGF